MTTGQQDNEVSRTTTPNPRRTVVTFTPMTGGTPIAAHGITKIVQTQNIKGQTGSYLNYFMSCFALAKSPRFHDEFPVDCCITVHDAQELQKRMASAIQEQLPLASLRGGVVTYYKPDLPLPLLPYEDLIFRKDASKYEWQAEYRFVIIAPPGTDPNNRLNVTLGSLSDICSIEPIQPSVTQSSP